MRAFTCTSWLVAALGLCAPVAAMSGTTQPLGLPAVSFGFKGGLALAQHQGTTPRDMQYTVESTSRRDFAAGLFLILPVSDRFEFQQEVLYVRKGSRQDIGVDVFDVPTVVHVTYDMDYLEIPVLMRYLWDQRTIRQHRCWRASASA